MEKPKRARKRKPDTSQGGPEATSLRYSGGQGVHREVESEGLEEIVSRRRQERHAVREMRVDPSEPPCRGRYQTAISCCGPMVVVVNVMVKRRGIRSRHVGMREPSASELLKTHRYPFKRRQNRGCLLVPGKAWWIPAYRPCGVRCIGGGNLIRAFVRNLRTWWAMVTEKAQTAKTVRPKVRMR